MIYVVIFVNGMRSMCLMIANYLNADSVGKSRYINHTAQVTESPDLGNAQVVITGGRALKSAENFKMIEKLAEKLGAAGMSLKILFIRKQYQVDGLVCCWLGLFYQVNQDGGGKPFFFFA